MSDRPFVFACPVCGTPLQARTTLRQRCPVDDTCYECVDGIWRFLRPEVAAGHEVFVQQYETVRQAEGWGSDDTAYYRALPFADLSGRFPDIWHVRAKSFSTMVERIARPLASGKRRPLRILDLGAGNGWLSYRLAQEGHQVAAIDLLTNPYDGLGAHVWYESESPFIPVQATFDRLPFVDDQADLVIFNGAVHYAADYAVTLGEALRVLVPDGRLVIMDSPVYQEASSGAQMVRERQARFRREYGFGSQSLSHENYLTYDRLPRLAQALAVEWQVIRPFYGWRWALRPWWARLRRHRQPAQFPLIVGRPQPEKETL